MRGRKNTCLHGDSNILWHLDECKPYKVVCGEGKRSCDIAKEEEIFSGSGVIKDAVMEDIGMF